ncbi:cupin domain-containing protein [Aquimarina aquimarini]|uniref:cupin domain-containing protein n=1 Tax=Aquimarina aquimarini TaxID=1191734 RepID=UPI000D551B01|nr:cupin domain-containing protein [Aquimarina aquimarini]
MKKVSILKDLEYKLAKPNVQILLETESSKEIRIAIKKGQIMKEHQTPFPIIVEIFEGEIDFGVQRTVHNLTKGDLVALEGGVPHDLEAKENSIIRLTISKSDTLKRVKEVAS